MELTSDQGVELTTEERRGLHFQAREAIISALRELGGSAERIAIIERARVAGGFSRRQLDSPAPRRSRGRHRRLVDYELSWAMTNLKRGGVLENPRRDVWRLTTEAPVSPETVADWPAMGDRLNELRAMPFIEYLRTPEWQRTRAAALMRAGHRCSLDSAHQDGLNVHHNTYKRLGTELASDLIVLCRGCHRRHHVAPAPD